MTDMIARAYVRAQLSLPTNRRGLDLRVVGLLLRAYSITRM